MKELALPLIDELPRRLISPERYAGPALQASVALNLPLPEVARVYNFPTPSEELPDTAA